MMSRNIARIILITGCLVLAGLPSAAAPVKNQGPGRTGRIYVPVYSSIYYGDREKLLNLTVTLSIRNTDRSRTVSVDAVDYYNGAGKLVRRHLAQGRTLAPLESFTVVIDESDTSGGASAQFIVVWSAAPRTAAPLAEAVMIGTRNQLGISFISRGVALEQ